MLKAIFQKKLIIVTFLLLLQFIFEHPLAVSAASTEVATGWKSISTGSTHNLAVKLDGTVWIWGAGEGELFGKAGERTVQDVPLQVKGLNNMVQVVAGGSHALALKDDGTVWSWGGNTEGELGDGTKSVYDGKSRSYIKNENKFIPLQVKGIEDIVYIAAGHAVSYAVKKDGSLWAWGSLIGNKPVQLKEYSDIQSISIGYGHIAILKTDGTVWQRASSLPSYRDGALQNLGSSILVQIKGLTSIVAVAAGGGTTHALRDDGTVWGWGYNGTGEIGDGTSIDRSEPVKITAIQDVTAIASSAGGPFYLKRDGSLWSNGSNLGGQLGIGSYENRLVPTRVEGLVKIKNIASSGIGFRVMALRQDNTLWSWGNGYVGDGTKWWRTSPVWIKSNANEVLTRVPLTVEVNGMPVDFDQQPIVINKKTLVPLAKILEKLGAEFEWNELTKTVTAIKGSTTLKLTIGEAAGSINGKAVPLEAPAVTINGRTMVPARFIGEAFGATIDWNESTKTVIIEFEEVEPVVIPPVEVPTEPIVNYLTLKPDEAIGRIEGKDAVGIPDLIVSMHAKNDNMSPSLFAITDKNGYFKIRGLKKDQTYITSYHQESSTSWGLISHNGINYCKNDYDTFTFTTSQQIKSIVLEQVQVTGKLLNQDNKPITHVTVLVEDKSGNFMGISRFSSDEEGIYSLCGLVENETYTVNLMMLFEVTSEVTFDTIPRLEYQPYTFTYNPNITTLPDLKVTIKEVKK